MKMLLSLTLAVLMSLTPMIASTGLGTTPAAAQNNQRGAFSIPLATRTGHPATLTITRFVARDGQLVALANLSGFTSPVPWRFPCPPPRRSRAPPPLK